MPVAISKFAFELALEKVRVLFRVSRPGELPGARVELAPMETAPPIVPLPPRMLVAPVTLTAPPAALLLPLINNVPALTAVIPV